MKRFVILLGCLLATLECSGQGFITFNNIGSPILSGLTGEGLGAGYDVELVWG